MYKKIRALIANWITRTPKRIRIILHDGTELSFMLVKNVAKDFYVLERSPSTDELIEKERWRVRMKINPETSFMMFFTVSDYTTLRVGDKLHVEVGTVNPGSWQSFGSLIQDSRIASINRA